MTCSDVRTRPFSPPSCSAEIGSCERRAALGLLLALAGVDGARAEEVPVRTSTAAEGPALSDVYEFMSLEKFVVYTASMQEESLRETPAPVTVITREMIRAIGARHLLDILTTYVPGMTHVVDHNELNVAMRGIYASSQQKILVMLNGHRLNSRAYSEANPDYALGIVWDHVKQIEVLRGPGSSLYGNVALTAVVNIVTEAPGAIDGAVVRVGAGDYFSRGEGDLLTTDGSPFAAGRLTSFTYGKAFDDRHDLLFWGSYFVSDGQRIPIGREEDFSRAPMDGFAIADGFRDPGAYDFGLVYDFGDFSVLASARHAKMIEPFSAAGPTGEVYDYDRYRTFDTLGPGLSSASRHLELKYQREVTAETEVELRLYYDTNHLSGVVVSNPAQGRAVYLGWRDRAVGGLLVLRRGYRLLGEAGNVTLGAQIDGMWLTDSNLLAAVNGEWTAGGDTRARPVLLTGSETISSGFVQVKQRLLEAFIANVGVRYDNKDRRQGPNVTNLSPRVALVWVPDERFDLKLSYGDSFVDSPYWYRYNFLPEYQGADTLRPERLRSVQLTPSVSAADGAFRATVNLFYDHVFDFVIRNNTPAPGEPIYQNAGSVKSVGVEPEVAFVQRDYAARANATFHRVLDFEDFGADDSLFFNVPWMVANLILDFRPLWWSFEDLWGNVTLKYASGQLAPITQTSRLEGGAVVRFEDPDRELPRRLLVSSGLRYSNVGIEGLDLDLTVYNLLDTEYRQGGSVVHPYPQAGRSYFLNLGYRFTP